MILKGKTNIRKFTVTDPHYDSKVKCRLSKQLPKDYDWNVEIHLKKGVDDSFGITSNIMDVTIYIERVEDDSKVKTFHKKELVKFSWSKGLKTSTNFIGVDTAEFDINDVNIDTTSDGKFGGFYILTNPTKYSNYPKGLVGIQCIIYFDDNCSCSLGYDLIDYDEVKKLFEHIFKTELEVLDKEVTNE